MDVLQFAGSIFRVERVHLEGCGIHEMTRTDEPVEHAVLAEDMADILTQETFDALAEFLDPLDVDLRHAPGAVGGIRATRTKRLYGFFRAEVPRDVGDEIPNRRK